MIIDWPIELTTRLKDSPLEVCLGLEFSESAVFGLSGQVGLFLRLDNKFYFCVSL